MRTKTTIIIEYGSSYFFLYAFDWQLNGFVNDVTSIQTLQLPFQLRLRVKYYGITSIINFVWKLSCQLTACFLPRTKTIPWRNKPNSYYWFCKADIFNFSSECLVYCVLVQTAASRKTATDKYTEKDRHSHYNMRNKCEWLINWMKLRKVYATSADNNKREKIDDFILNPPKSLHTHFNFNFNSNNSIISFEYRKYALIIILVLYFLFLNFDGDFKITIDNWTTNEIKIDSNSIELMIYASRFGVSQKRCISINNLKTH